MHQLVARAQFRRNSKSPRYERNRIRTRSSQSLAVVAAASSIFFAACGGGDGNVAQSGSSEVNLTCNSWQQENDTCKSASLRIQCPQCDSSTDVRISFGFDPDGFLDRYIVETPDVDPETLDKILADIRNPDIDVAADNIPRSVLDQLNQRPPTGWESVKIDFQTKPPCVPIITGKFKVRCK